MNNQEQIEPLGIVVTTVLWALCPIWIPLSLGIKGVELIMDTTASQGQVTSADAHNVAAIIKAGHESGVKEMDITVSREHAVGFVIAQGKSKSGGIHTTIGAQGSTEYDIHVKYIT
jgi:hypothetical protein